MSGQVAVWSIVALSTLGVVLRPFGWPEAVWAVGGAAVLIGLGLLSADAAATGVLRGLDVYLFLVGMMALAELARLQGLFDWVAAYAVSHSRGSGPRLFTLVYGVGIVVTVFLSNDATAVVLTPAVYAVARAADVNPLPHLFACAFVANAASFVLPISNPANLVVFADRMPPLGEWLSRFGLPSVLAVAATYLGLRLHFRREIAADVVAVVARTALPTGGRLAAVGIAVATAILLWASWGGHGLGLPTAVVGLSTAALTLAVTRSSPMPLLRGIAWAVLPLVAGLFILVQALNATGVLAMLVGLLKSAAVAAPVATAMAVGTGVAFGTNLVNNLPAGLLAGAVVQGASAPPIVASAVLVGVDLGPNLSITGSLATILWLAAIRREGEDVSAWQFLKVGAFVMPPTLILSIVALLIGH